MAVEEKEFQSAGGESGDARAAHESAHPETATPSADDLERHFNQPGGDRADPVSADDLEKHFNAPSASGPSGGSGLAGGGLAGGAMGGSGGGGLGAKLGSSLKGLGKKRGKLAAFGGGGLATILVTAVIFFGTAELKLISLMHDIESHVFRRPQYTYEKRSDAWIKDAINSRYFAKDGDKINVQGLPFKEQVLQSLGFGMYSDLTADGGKLVVKNGSRAGERIITVTHSDGSEKTYSTYQEKGAARSDIGLWVDDQTDGEGWLKRKWIKHRITTLTGTKWHWLDPIQQPYNQAKIFMANQVAQYLIGSSSTATGLAADLMQALLDDNSTKTLGDALQAASTDEANQLLASALVDKLAASANDVGVAIAFISLDCGINKVVENNTIVKIAQQKAEIEYMTAYAAEQSQSDQMESGKTNGVAVGAAESLLTSDPGPDGKVHDVFESNNVQRSAGNPVPFQATDNCNDTAELCNSKLPANALNRTAIGSALQTSSDITNSAGYKVIASFIPGAPGGVTTDVLCGAFNLGPVQAALNFSNGAFDTIASNTPGLDYLWGDIKSASAGLFNALLHTVIEPVIPPIVDAGTKGPFLGSAVVLGGDLSSQAELGSPVAQEANNVTPCYQEAPTDQANDDSMCAAPLSPTQATLEDNDMEQEDINSFKSSSFLTQMASIYTPYSALSRILDRMPATPQLAGQDVGNVMVAAISPASWIHMIASLPSILIPKSHAGGPQDASTYIVQDDGSGNAVDQFKVTQYGFTEAQLNMSAGALPNADRNVGCSLTAKYRMNNPNEDIPECDQFEQATPAAAPGGTPPPPPPAGGPAPSASAQQLAQEILTAAGAGKISFAIVNPANSNDDSTAEDNIKDTANGQPAKTSSSCNGGGVLAPNKTANIDPTLLQFILDLSGQENITINELVGGCHDETNSNHYAGKAVDFGCPFNPAPADTIGSKSGISDGTGETCSTAGHYHYSIGGN